MAAMTLEDLEPNNPEQAVRYARSLMKRGDWDEDIAHVILMMQFDREDEYLKLLAPHLERYEAQLGGGDRLSPRDRATSLQRVSARVATMAQEARDDWSKDQD